MSATAAAVLWMFTTFATADEVDELKLDIAYGQFYDRLEDYNDALDDGNQELADEYRRQLERIRAKICEGDPNWERCDDDTRSSSAFIHPTTSPPA